MSLCRKKKTRGHTKLTKSSRQSFESAKQHLMKTYQFTCSIAAGITNFTTFYNLLEEFDTNYVNNHAVNSLT